jgi:hypothetical protein
MKTTIKQLTNSKHALEYLSLKALKIFGAGRKTEIPKIDVGSEFKGVIGATIKAQLEITEINKHRSATVKVIKKRKREIFDFNDWSKAPANDALVLLTTLWMILSHGLWQI